MVNVLIMADLFGAKESVGIILPMLVFSDVTVYPLFRKHASWKAVWPLVPPAIVGVVAGYFLLSLIDNLAARRAIGAIIFFMLALQVLRAYRQEFLAYLPDSKSFLWGTGGVIGISTMMANAAGPVYSVYALVHKMSKMEFLGIGARFFLFINIFKIPFMTNLDIINADSLRLNAALLPGAIAGILLGRMLISKIPQRVFEILLYFFSVVAGLRLLFF